MFNSFNIDQSGPDPDFENTQERYECQAKNDAQDFHTELFDLTARYSLSTLGDMERGGIGTVGETLMQAIDKLELLKQSL